MRWPWPFLLLLHAVLTLASFPSPAAGEAPGPYHAGELRRSTRTASAAARNRGDGTLRVLVWYPVPASAAEQEIAIGDPGHPVFLAGRVAARAPWVDESRRPLVLLSHGFGGTARQMTWLGTALARHGYVAVAVDHPGTNGRDGVTPEGAYSLWERAGDLTNALDLVLAEPALAAHVDTARIGVAGFSVGGWTAALEAGARADFAHLARFCDSPARDSICDPQLEYPVDFRKAPETLAHPAMRDIAAREGGSFRDPRVTAAFLIAPALGQAIDPASLREIRIPVAVLVGSADPVAVPATNAEVFARTIPGARLMVLPGVQHYDFLSECSPYGMAQAPAYCADPPGTARARTHAMAVAAALRFFDDTLGRR